MSLGSLPLAAAPLAAEGASVSSSGTGAMAPFSGVGTQGTIEFRGERFWATETRARWRARESDGNEMLGTTDKDPAERVWYEVDFIDVLNGASITSLVMATGGNFTVLTQELVSNGEQVHLARVLVSGGVYGPGERLKFYAQCSDGSLRARSLKIRLRDL